MLETERAKSVCASTTRAPTIALIEDDSAQRELIGLAMVEAGLRVDLLELHDGRAGLAQILAWLDGARDPPLPVLVLLDIQLPALSGIELLEALRQDGRPLPFPIVMLTSSRIADDLVQSFGRGAVSYFVKPSGFDELIRLMDTIGRRWLDAG